MSLFEVLDIEEKPLIKIKWIRGRGNLDFERPITSLNVGQRGSGKSSLLECLALRFPKVIDLFGSRDNEGLAWCRVAGKDQTLFVTGDSVEIKGRWNQSQVKDLRIEDLKRVPITISVSAFYGDLNEEFYGLNSIVYKNLYKRTHWRELWFLKVREAGNFTYARIKVTQSQHIAKADFIYLLRESRHMGYPVGVDTIRWTSIDKEIRDVSDYMFIKRVGIQGLPHDLRFVYRYINPFSLMNPHPSTFVVVSNRGPIGVGKFDLPKWHKKERDDLLTELGLEGRIKYGEVPDYGNESLNWLSDYEHGDIITYRFEGIPSDANKKSMHDVAEEVHRSPNTVMRHIHNHNDEVKQRGYCIKCRRIKHRLSEVEV